MTEPDRQLHETAGRESGLFIAFEGGDGSGKSTQANRLAAALEAKGHQVRMTFEPGDTGLGRTLRQIVLHSTSPVAPRTEALLYAADKAQHVAEVVLPALEAGQIVVCDRYVDSVIAYQGAGRTLDLGEIRRLAWWAVSGLTPDLTVLMDVPVAEAFAGKEDLDRIEAAGAEFHARVRRHFLDLAAERPERYLIVNGRGQKDEVSAQILGRVQELIASRDHGLTQQSESA
ncbi:MAG: dTMP kinase [Propionibacteriaceae bacterium]|jgi:dTMP kinase|nr:dTMP kinase [Propionibacteriaceae bacterium]